MEMVWMFSGIVFIAQIVTCMIFKDKLKRYLPTIIALFFLSTTVLRANMGDLDPQRMVNQMLVSLAGIAAAGYLKRLYLLKVCIILQKRKNFLFMPNFIRR